MTLQLMAEDRSPIRERQQYRAALALRHFASSAVRFAWSFVSAVISVIRDDLDHGQISRDPRDWER